MRMSVLTIVKDRPEHLAQLIEGLGRSETLPGELLIVDMGSDPPVEVQATPYPVHIVRLDQAGLPLAAARNAAAHAARGDMLLFLDVDCIPMRGLTTAMADALDGQDALICAEALYLGPRDARGQWDETALMSRAKPHPVRPFPAVGLREEQNAGLFWSLIFGIRRERFVELGGFDEGFSGYGAEDTDFGFRAKAAAMPLLFMGGTGAFHQYHDVIDPPLQHLADIVRNARLFRKKWGMWPMEGWLDAFEKAELIARVGDSISLLRLPTVIELDRARVATPD
ncbi:glycosyltransferase family 2 protein [Sphingobium sp. Ant17]|uniref:glycosyltransferase family 2 protein n=1 Tax=Sphingobium sp. Ant17 TaxID=1461752 RepID=UPI0004B5CF4D|nr:glycosyltransferase [Sphingobium sp. Ant17]